MVGATGDVVTCSCLRDYHPVNPSCCLFQVTRRHNVVAFEHITGFMSCNHHRYPFRNPSANQIPDCCSAEVVRDSPTRQARLFASPVPRLTETTDLVACFVKDPRTAEQAKGRNGEGAKVIVISLDNLLAVLRGPTRQSARAVITQPIGRTVSLIKPEYASPCR